MSSRKICGLVSVICFAGVSMASDEGSLSGDVGYVYSGEQEGSYVETNLFYGLPWGVKGYTYLDLYNLGGYFGETSLDKPILNGIGPKIHLQHVGEPLSNVGLGVSATIPDLPKWLFLKVGLVPFWMNKDTGIIEDKLMGEYAFSVDLSKKFVFSGFGNVNFAGKGGVTWGYGELELARRISKNVRLGYSASLQSGRDGEATPGVEHRIALRFGF